MWWVRRSKLVLPTLLPPTSSSATLVVLLLWMVSCEALTVSMVAWSGLWMVLWSQLGTAGAPGVASSLSEGNAGTGIASWSFTGEGSLAAK